MNKTKNKLLVTALAIGFSVVGCGVLMGNASTASAYAAEPETVCVHEYVTETVAPTCLVQGYTVYTCSQCGDSYRDKNAYIFSRTYNAAFSLVFTID